MSDDPRQAVEDAVMAAVVLCRRSHAEEGTVVCPDIRKALRRYAAAELEAIGCCPIMPVLCRSNAHVNSASPNWRQTMTDTEHTPGPMVAFIRETSSLEQNYPAVLAKAREQDRALAAAKEREALLVAALKSYVLVDNHEDSNPRLQQARAALAAVEGQ